jgi:hypothetical protein
MKASFTITGTSPLLMHNPLGMAKQNKGKSKIKKGAQEFDPAEDAEAGTYRTEKGDLYVPSIALRSCLINGCKGMKIGKLGAKTIIAGAVEITDLPCVLYEPKTRKPISTYEIDTRRAVIQKQGILRSRPKIFPWALDWEIDYDPDFVSPGTIVEILQRAGVLVGLLDYRPEKSGPFGKFTAEYKTE